jgi:predicted DNA-binding transcriptional regulator AlpA
MVEPTKGETLREIATRHGRAYNTLRNQWSRHPDWPDPLPKKRGRSYVYDPAAVDRVIAQHFGREAAELEPHRLYTAREIETLTGVTAATIRADVTRGRWPAPDDTSQRAHRWYGETVTTALTARRGYRRGTEG